MPVLVNELVIMLRGNIYCNIYSVINLISFPEKILKMYTSLITEMWLKYGGMENTSLILRSTTVFWTYKSSAIKLTSQLGMVKQGLTISDLDFIHYYKL